MYGRSSFSTWTGVSVGGVQYHNFSLLAADVEADLLCKDVELPDFLLDMCGGEV